MANTDLLEQYTSAKATHLLACRHCIGPNCTEYAMRCTLIKDMGDGRSKVVVFGDRNWRDRDHIKRIRYVPNNRLSAIKKTQRLR